MSTHDNAGEAVAYVGLGANLCDRAATLRAAVEQLARRRCVRVVRVSPLVETAPVGGPPQPLFLNAVAEVATVLEPRALLDLLHEVEAHFGRRRVVRWGPRTLDLDLLLYADRVICEPGLRVPHPRMHERRFVLEPLCAIAPHAVHPVTGRTARQMLADLQT